jgi:hypothetical protein
MGCFEGLGFVRADQTSEGCDQCHSLSSPTERRLGWSPREVYAGRRPMRAQISTRVGSPRLQNHTFGIFNEAKLFFMKVWWKLSPVHISVWTPPEECP